MDSSNDQMELEEGEINDLEDGEIEDEETVQKTPSNVSPSSSVNSDFPRTESTCDKSPHLNPKLPKPERRRENGPPLRYNNNVGWPKERDKLPTRALYHVKPSFHVQGPAGPRPTMPWNRGKQRRILYTFIIIRGLFSSCDD